MIRLITVLSLLVTRTVGGRSLLVIHWVIRRVGLTVGRGGLLAIRWVICKIDLNVGLGGLP